MTNRERAEKIVTKFNSEGTALSNTDETYLQELILKNLDEAVREAIKHHHFTEKCCDACFDSGKEKGFADAQEECARIAERHPCLERCSHGHRIPEEIAERIRGLKISC